MEDRSLIDSCLPLSLQDLCLLVIINDLDIYPMSLLASLPRWFRHRLLNNLPVVDLCLLDHSPVARGIDVNEIWKTRYPPSALRRVHGQFMVQEYWVDHISFEMPMEQRRPLNGQEISVCSAHDLEGLDPKLEQALQGLPRSPKYGEYCVDHRTEYLTQIALGLLLVDENDDEFHVPHTHGRDDRVVLSSILEAIARECVSINGNLLLQDLTKASNSPYYNLPSYSVSIRRKGVKENHFLIWKQQGIPLLKQIDIDVEITPKRYMTIRNKANKNELMTLISQSFGLKAHIIHLDMFKLECQSGPQILSLLKYLLRDVQILGIYRSSDMIRPHAKQDCINLQTIMEICVGSGVECQLGALSCDLRKVDPRHLSPYLFTPDGDDRQPHYSGLSVFQCRWICTRNKLVRIVRLIQQHLSLKYVSLDIITSVGITDKSYPESAYCFATLASLFQRPHFQVLNIRCHMKNMDLLTLLVHGFMSAPCSGNQQLSLFVSDNLPSNFLFNVSIPLRKENLKATLDCGVKHKRLLFITSNLNYTRLLDSCSILEVLLRFPSIRLKDLMFECVPDAGGNYPFLHLAALHPDLRLSALLLHFNRGLNKEFLLTVKEDFKNLFSMSTLKEISIDGYWDEFTDIVQALILGLEKVKSLNKISLGSCSTKYTQNEHIAVWKSLFAFPRLDELEAVIKGHFVAKVNECAHLICDTWKQSLPARRRMKSIQLTRTMTPNNEDYYSLSEICESYSIIN